LSKKTVLSQNKFSNQLTSKKKVFQTHWFNLIEKKFSGHDYPFYSLQMKDYVTVIAETIEQKIIIVSQFRPAVEKETFEFPSGHIEDGEDPAAAAERELFEETGYTNSNIELLGSLYSDTGRHENRLWCYWINNVYQKTGNYLEKDTIKVHTKTKSQFYHMIKNGDFFHAMDLAALGLAQARGKI